MYRTTQDDPRISDMDPVQKLWMYYNWQADQEDQIELAKNHAYLVASFWNPEAVRKVVGDDSSTFASTEEEFDESTRMIDEINNRNAKNIGASGGVTPRKRRRAMKD